MSQSRAPAQEPSETPSPREQIRSHMKMVIQQLEGILRELKDVAHELREVVGQIDKLTSDLELDMDADDWTVATASSTSSSERGLCEAFRLDFLGQDSLSDSWDFCSFLESSSRRSAPDETRPAPPATASVYSQMNGGLPVPNGPLIITPDSSSEEASSSTHSHSQKTSRTAGTRERVRFSDKILYHALCCDDDEDGGDEEEDKLDTDSERSPLTGSPVPPLSELPPGLHNCRESHTLPRKDALNPGCRKKLLRNSSTQTVSDKSTQTLLPYVPAKHRNKDL